MPPRSRSSSSSTSRVLLGSLLWGLAGLAQAQTSALLGHDALLLACHQTLACKSHLDRATELYKEERYSVAVEEYQAAYRLQPYPPILYNIARLHYKQNHLAEAVAYYQRYLDSSHPEQADRAKQFLSQAQQELALEQSKPAPAPPLPVVPSALSTSVAPAARLALVTPVAPTGRRANLPTYKKWWLWTLVGTAAAGAVMAIGIGVYASGPDISGLPTKTATVGH